MPDVHYLNNPYQTSAGQYDLYTANVRTRTERTELA